MLFSLAALEIFLFITNFQQSDYECASGFFSSLSSLLSFLDMCFYSFLSNLENDLPLLLKVFLFFFWVSLLLTAPLLRTPIVFLFQPLSRVRLFAIPMDCSTPGFLVLHCLPEFAQTCVHWVSNAIHPSHPLSSPSPPALHLSQHQGLFQSVRITCMLSYFSLSFSLSFSEVYYFSFFSLSFWIGFMLYLYILWSILWQGLIRC